VRLSSANRENLRCCVDQILSALGVVSEPPPDEYLDALEQLNTACVDWFRERAPKFGFLQINLPELRPDLPLVTGPLSAAAVHWAGNLAARDFFEYIDRQTQQKCTLLQFQVLRLMQEAHAGAEVNASGGAS